MVKQIKKLALTDIWPGKNNGYIVEVTYDIGGEEHKAEHLMHKEQVENWEYLQKMKKKLSEADFKELEKVMKDWGDYMYNKALDQAAEDAAGADL